jgi:hypothetical protein
VDRIDTAELLGTDAFKFIGPSTKGLTGQPVIFSSILPYNELLVASVLISSRRHSVLFIITLHCVPPKTHCSFRPNSPKPLQRFNSTDSNWPLQQVSKGSASLGCTRLQLSTTTATSTLPHSLYVLTRTVYGIRRTRRASLRSPYVTSLLRPPVDQGVRFLPGHALWRLRVRV